MAKLRGYIAMGVVASGLTAVGVTYGAEAVGTFFAAPAAIVSTGAGQATKGLADTKDQIMQNADRLVPHVSPDQGGGGGAVPSDQGPDPDAGANQ